LRQKPRHPPKSPIATAIRYALNQWGSSVASSRTHASPWTTALQSDRCVGSRSDARTPLRRRRRSRRQVSPGCTRSSPRAKRAASTPSLTSPTSSLVCWITPSADSTSCYPEPRRARRGTRSEDAIGAPARRPNGDIADRTVAAHHHLSRAALRHRAQRPRGARSPMLLRQLLVTREQIFDAAFSAVLLPDPNR